MAILVKQICNIRLIAIILNIAILIDLYSTAPTLIPQNLTNHSDMIFNENITKESLLTLPSIIDEIVINITTTEIPRSNRNATKPLSVQKSKKLTKNLNTKKTKEKNLKYSISSTVKQQISNNSVKNTTQSVVFTASTFAPTLTTPQVKEIVTDSTFESKIFTENINQRTIENFKISNDTETSQILKPTKLPESTIISPVTVTTTTNSNISDLSKLDEHGVPIKNNKTTSIPVQTTSIPHKQFNVELSTFPTTKSELIMSTAIIVTKNDNDKVIQNEDIESSTPLTMNINIHQRLEHNKTDNILLINNSVVNTNTEKNYSIFKNPIINDNNFNMREITPIPMLPPIKTTPLSSLVSSLDIIVTTPQTNQSEKIISELTTEIPKNNVIYATVIPLLEVHNNSMIGNTLKLNNTEQIVKLHSIERGFTKQNTESAKNLINVKDDNKTDNIIPNSVITNNTNQINNSSRITLMGHDGVKITKKKQLVEKHFKDDDLIKQSLTKIHNINESVSSGENIKNNKTDRYNKLEIKENSLGPIIMREETTTDDNHNEKYIVSTTTEENNYNEKSIMSTTESNVEMASTTQENKEEFTTETDDKIDTTILLDIDLMPKISQIESITEIPTFSTTENEFIKHKNFEKSLISKMEWIPIENIDHSLMSTKVFETKTDKLDTFEQTTILPLQLTSEITGYEIKPDLLTNTEFIETKKLRTESDPKSLEIELIDSPNLSSDKNIKSVPEFFEIATTKQHQNNNEKDTDSSPIEIQINVSEGFGNETENLEFSFRQQPSRLKQKHITQHLPPPGFQEIGEITIQRSPDLNTLQPIPLLDYKQKNLKSTENDDILQVEITAIDNTTKVDEKQMETLNDTPKFTVHNEQNLELRENDDFFVPDLKMDPIEETGKNHENSERDSIDQDSDTIFYISNTEVKVVESLPTSNNSNHEFNNIRNSKNNISQNSNRSKLESQFFPTIYEEDAIIDTSLEQKNQSKINSFDNKKLNFTQENIILSPIKKFLEPIKINKNQDEIILNSGEKSYKSAAAVAAAAAPDVSYVGETFIDIEESTVIPNEKYNRKLNTESHTIKTTTSTKKDTDFPVIIMDADMNSSGALLSDVIIQPAIVPEMSIGVPVIGELPPQIELKEIDFLPGNDDKENHDKLTDGGSIQYGADLIADEAELNDNPNRYIFESGYPFTDDKINRVDRIRNNEDIDILDRDDNDTDNDDVMATSQQIIMHAVDNLQREQLIADLPSDSWEGYKEIPIKRNNLKLNNIVVTNSTNYIINNSTNYMNSTGVNGTEILGNATAFSVLEDNDVSDFNLADIQTLIIACLATLVPLILSLLTAFGLRYLWKKYHRDHDEGSGLVGDSSTDPLAAKSVAISQDELQTTESGYTLNRSNDTLESNTDITGRTSGTIIDGVVNCVSNDGINQCNNGLRDINTISTNQPNGNAVNNKNLSNHCGANGSVTTMTLKNNHLIVETEERNDISRDARETKMHYTSSEKDGVFVVEVARGADSTGAPGSPHKDLANHQKSYNIDIENIEQKQQTQDECNHEEVQIHQPPPTDPDTLIEVDESADSPVNSEKNYHNLGNSNTGLSQSDLSSSSDDSNKAYSYGKQELYTIPMNGYSPSSLQPKLISSQPLDSIDNICTTIAEFEVKENNNNNIKLNKDNNCESKPFITAALLKQDTINELTIVAKDNLKVNCGENNCNGENKMTESNKNLIKTNDIEISVDSTIVPELSDNIKMNKMEEENRTNYKNDKKISGLDQEIIQTNSVAVDENYENGNTNTNGIKEKYLNETETNIDNCINGENGFDSIISLPEPPSTEEIKQMNDIILMENSQLDSLPPPPPPIIECQTVSTIPAITLNTNGNINSFNNISPIPESIIEDDKLLENDECDENTILTLSTTKDEHTMNELQNGIGGGGNVVVTPLTVNGSS